jgi:hypothetical protein
MNLIGEKVTFKVQSTDAAADDANIPKLLSFPSGAPHDTSNAELFLWRKKSGSKVKQTLTCEADGIVFRGTDYGVGSGASSDSFNYAIGVYDKSSHTMSLVPTHHPFAMSRLPLTDTSSGAVSDMTSWERRSALTEQFGSRKRQRAAKAAESNIISYENISGAGDVEANMAERSLKVEEGAKVASAAQLALSEQRLQLLPAWNELAVDMSEAYPLDDLLPEDVRTVLAEEYAAKVAQMSADSITDKNSWLDHFFPNVSGEYLSSLVEANITDNMAKHKKSSKFRTCGLLYLDMLLNFYILTSTSNSAKKSEVLAKFAWPESVLDHIAQKFAVIKKVRNEDVYQRNKQIR